MSTALDAKEPSRATPVPSAWAPLANRTFAVLWGATLVGNVGLWMRDVGSGWLMTSLSPSPLMVSLVQAAGTLPIFLLSLPAGALADLVDRRRLLIGVQVGLLALAIVMTFVTATGGMTPGLLLAATLLGGVGTALAGPVWQSAVPEIVGPKELRSAVALNSLGINISRAIGPALGGALVAAFGAAAAYAADALTYLPVIAALLWWRRDAPDATLPPEHMLGAMVGGVRYARASPDMRAALLRAAVFFLFGSAPWALLPLVVRDGLRADAGFYGLLLAAIGVGAVAGALALPRIRAALSSDQLVLAGTLGVAASSLGLGLSTGAAPALLACLVLGVSWIVVLTTLNVAAQSVLPGWVRGRGLAIYLTTFYGAMTFGSALWGQVAGLTSVATSLMLAGVLGALSGVVALSRSLPSGDADLTPSSHWPEPLLAEPVEDERGPVTVTVEYRIEPARAGEFVAAVHRLADERRRDGAYAWSLTQDAADPARYVEIFTVESWAEHLRQHARVTKADADLQAEVRRFHVGGDAPRVEHLIGVRPKPRRETLS